MNDWIYRLELKQEREQKKEEEMEALKRTMRSGMVKSANLSTLFSNLNVHYTSFLNVYLTFFMCFFSGTSNERPSPT